MYGLKPIPFKLTHYQRIRLLDEVGHRLGAIAAMEALNWFVL
jgi:hypothetical protein